MLQYTKRQYIKNNTTQYFGFIDETGVLSDDKSQRFFALGLLKLLNTSPIFEAIKRLKDKHKKPKGFEFKFTGIKKDSDLKIHKELVDICLTDTNFAFACIVVDKLHKRHSRGTSTWEMQLDLAKTHIKSNIKKDEKIAIIADYLSKPNNSSKYFEIELQKQKEVFNACMIESDSSVFVQVVDILIGCITYRFKIDNNLNASISTPKGKLVKYIEDRLLVSIDQHKNNSKKFKKTKKLSCGFTIYEPYYFSVYEKYRR